MIYWGRSDPFFMEDYIFPVKIVSEKVNTDLDELVQYINEYRETNSGVVKSNCGGWQSKIHSTDEFINSIKFFSESLGSAIETYKRGSRFGHMGLELNMESYWFNVNPPGTYNSLHIHPGSILSGVFWISCPENCGRLIIRHPNEMVNYYLGPDELSIDPREGTLVLFPSYIPHLVEVNESSKDRISIAFNLSIKK